MNLQQLRDYVRMQLDMDEEELPNAMLDSYFSEGYMRTISMEPRWPFFEAVFDAVKLADSDTVTLPASCDSSGLHSVIDTTANVRLVQVSNEQAESYFTQLQVSTQPAYYTIWGSQLKLWPSPNEERPLKLRGYRYPTDWISGGAASEVDADVRLHMLIAHYAIALAYAQQEDEVLEDVYMKRWQASFAAARAAICNPRHHRPAVLNGGLPFGAPHGGLMAWGPPVAP